MNLVWIEPVLLTIQDNYFMRRINIQTLIKWESNWAIIKRRVGRRIMRLDWRVRQARNQLL